MKRRLVVSALALVLLLGLAAAETAGCTNANAGNLPKGVMARVGQVSITQEQLDAKVAAYAKFGAAPDKTADPTGYGNFRRDVLDDMITYELIRQQSAALEISVTAKEVEDSIDKFKTDTYNGDQAAFDDALKEHNITPDELNTSYSESLLMQKAYDAVTKSLTDSSITQEELQAFYNLHSSDLYQRTTRTARHILIAPVKPAATSSAGSSTGPSNTTTTVAPTQAQWAAALATAQKVHDDLVAGADWKTEAASYSDDAGSKDNGGELGSVGQGEQVTFFDVASVFSLSIGDISQPVKVPDGYDVLQVESVIPGRMPTLDEVKSQLLKTILADKKNAAWQDWLSRARVAAKVSVLSGMEATTTTTDPRSAMPTTTVVPVTGTPPAGPTTSTSN